MDYLIDDDNGDDKSGDMDIGNVSLADDEESLILSIPKNKKLPKQCKKLFF